jgi:hypothetical protein
MYICRCYSKFYPQTFFYKITVYFSLSQNCILFFGHWLAFFAAAASTAMRGRLKQRRHSATASPVFSAGRREDPPDSLPPTQSQASYISWADSGFLLKHKFGLLKIFSLNSTKCNLNEYVTSLKCPQLFS